MRFKLHSPGTIGAIKIDWDAPIELTPEIREAMAPNDVDTMRTGALIRGFVIGNVTYPRGTIAFRVADGHELFLQLPIESEPAPAKLVVAATWTVESESGLDHHRGTVGTKGDGERIDIFIATTAPSLSRAKVQRLIEQGHVRIGGQPIKKTNHRLRAGDVIEVDVTTQILS